MISQTGRQWVISRQNRRVAYVSQDGNRQSVTIIECGRSGIPSDLHHHISESLLQQSASQPFLNPETQESRPYLLPPVFITAGVHYTETNFKYFYRNELGEPNILNGARYRKSKKGYNEKDICFWYVKEHFDPLTQEFDENGNLRHRLLILDGHGSHLTYDIIKYCMSRNIHILCLPGHSTHRLQPMDVGIFGPLDREYKKLVESWGRNRTGDNGNVSLAAFF